ncbi:hypothetical protein GCM10010129_19620 [Streptomyces fumigatiscleroticus]|nr:hypothetical protein GCM10010129_19620 [Streptomyces fumigatiscleroticus]
MRAGGTRGGSDDRSRGGSDDRSRGGSDDRSRGGSDDRSRGGSDDRSRGGSDDRSRGGSDDRSRGGSPAGAAGDPVVMSMWIGPRPAPSVPAPSALQPQTAPKATRTSRTAIGLPLPVVRTVDPCRLTEVQLPSRQSSPRPAPPERRDTTVTGTATRL